MTSVRQSLLISLVERYLLIALALAGNIILARLLTPEQIGIYSVSIAVIGIAQVLRDFGIGNFLIQQRDLSDDHVATAFGLSLIVGATLFAAVMVAAPWAASFYGEALMLSTLRITALNFLLLPFCTISLALLRREMQFQRILVVTMVAATLGFAVTIWLASTGFGPNSMALGSLATNLITGVGAWMARPTRRVLRPSLRSWRALLRFGGQSSVTGVVTSIAMDANDLVVGKILGFQAVAILSRAQGIMNLFHRDLMGAVRGVALPAFSAAHRREEDLERQHVHGIAIVTVLGWPFYALMSLYSLEALRLLFGPQWDAAVPLVRLFCLAGAISAINALTPSLLIGAGHIGTVTKAELIIQPARLAMLVIAVVYWRSVEACAWAYVAATVFGIPLFQFFKHRAIPTHLSSTLRIWAASAAVTLAISTPALLHTGVVGHQRVEPIPLPFTAMSVLAGLLLGLAVAIWSRHPLIQEPLVIRFLAPLARRLGPMFRSYH